MPSAMTNNKFRCWLAACVLGGGAACSPAMGADDLGLERQTVRGGALDYAPADGAVSRANPPALRWIPAKKKDARYRVEIAADNTFAAPVYQAANLQWRIDVPAKTLAPGRYYWRFGVETDDNKTAWSRARAFSIAEDASPFPFPDYDYVARIPKEHPRLFATPQTLPALRARFMAGGDLSASGRELLAGVRQYFGGTLVEEPAFLPVPPPGSDRTERDRLYSDIITVTRPSITPIENCATAYLLTGDKDAAAEAKRRLLYFLSWNPEGSTGLFNNDEPAMNIMMVGAPAYDWLYNLLTPDERKFAGESLLKRGRDMFTYLTRIPFDSNPWESHAGRMVGLLGQAAIILAPEHEEARGWLDYLIRIYYGAYPSWGGDEGGYNEGVHYWVAYNNVLLNFFVALKNATGINLSGKPFFQNTPYYYYYSMGPRQMRTVFGDCFRYYEDPAWTGALMNIYSKLLNDPYLRYYYEKTSPKQPWMSMAFLTTMEDPVKARAPVDLPTSRLFPDVGLVAMHNTLVDEDAHVGMLFHANPYGGYSHAHYDQNTFGIEAYGEPLAISTGHYNYYGSPHHLRWVRETKSKCGITIDGGKGQDGGWPATGKITRFDDSPAFTLAAGDATPAYGGRLAKAMREVVFIKAAGVFVTRDDLASDEPHSYEYWLHALDEMKIDATAKTVLTQRPQASLHVSFITPDELAFAQTSKFDPPITERMRPFMVDHYHLTAATRKAKNMNIVTVLAAVKTGATAPVVTKKTSPTTTGVEIRAADGRQWLVGFANPGTEGEPELDGVKYTGRFFVTERH
jgi:hypothetical protein